MRVSVYLVMLLTLLGGAAPAQQRLQVSTQRFGKTRVYEVFKYEVMEYKLRGDLRYRKRKIAHMQDSLIIFSNDSVVKLNQIKAIRLRKNVHLVQTMQGIFLGFGVGFVTLNTANNLIMQESPVFNLVSAVISAGFLAGSFLIRELELKRIRMTRHKDLRIIDVDYRHLNSAGPE